MEYDANNPYEDFMTIWKMLIMLIEKEFRYKIAHGQKEIGK